MHNYIRYPHASVQGFNARDVARAYNAPLDQADGTGVKIGIIELGGAYSASDMTAAGLSGKNVSSVNVAGGKPKSDGPDGADGEVALDVQVVVVVAPGAKVVIYNCPNTDAGFLAGIKQARLDGCAAISVSWGGPENQWDSASVQKFEAEFLACRNAGIPVFVAAGDEGSTDGTKSNVTDYPASSPNTVGCGGTRLTVNSDGSRKAETVWDDNPKSDATGGGVSKTFPGRHVPDIAGNADPESGYLITVDGQQGVIGGTSAVAPLWAGIFALLKQLVPGAWDFYNVVADNSTMCFDVVTGTNGGFKAAPGRDDVSGFGVPDAGKLLEVLRGGTTTPPVTTPPVTNPPVTTPPVTTTSHDRAFIEDVAARCTAYLKTAS